MAWRGTFWNPGIAPIFAPGMIFVWGGILVKLIVTVLAVALLVLGIRALVKYFRNGDAGKGKSEVRKSLGETLKEHRLRCKMTQEFVADTIGISRQTVSKWESGVSEPGATEICALAKLYGVPAEELLRSVKI